MAPHALPAGMTLSHATQNNNSIVWGVIGLSSGLILILMYLRLCCNRTAKYRTEDYLGLLSLLFFFASVGVLSQIPRRSGFFVHQRDQTEESTEWFLYYYSVSATIQHVTKFLIQMGTFIEFSHIFVATPWKNPTWWVSYALMVVSTIVCLASVLVEVFTCQPRERFWKPSVPGTCVDSAHFNITISSVHLVLDVFVFAIPQAVVWWAKALTRRNKIRVSMAFSVSILLVSLVPSPFFSLLPIRRVCMVLISVLSSFFELGLVLGQPVEFNLRSTSAGPEAKALHILASSCGDWQNWRRRSLCFVCLEFLLWFEMRDFPVASLGSLHPR
ncbi:hypothetical protein EV127DRAFT_488501 [Xylaria flabelliformis]|nr:hypothetical protein EV127DRAFT_488501 [Xylaria flabelliformis]